MELQGYVPYESNTPRTIASKDKFVFVRDGHEKVITVLLTRRHNLICRSEGEQGKFELMFTTWDQEDNLPMIYNGGQLFLWVPKDALPSADTPVRIPRTKPAAGESKIAKCRAIYAAHKDLPKDDVLKMFVEQAGCTPQGAVTYYITCRKG
jgi:hypothetical protein